MGIRTFWATVAATTVLSGLPAPVLAAEADDQFPNRPIRFIVPVAPGGGTDFLARLVAQRAADRWGKNVIVDNRGGATGLIGLEFCARAAPDGYTLAFTHVGHMLVAQLSGKLSFKRGGDFTPVAHVGDGALLFVVHPGVPAKSVKELVELARSKPRELNYASGGNGSLQHLATELFRSMNSIEITHVPYQGAGPALPDVIAGRVQMFMTSPSSATHVQAGRLRALAVTGAKRLPTLADVPTFAEAGYPRYNVTTWFGIFGPARMPAPLLAKLSADLNAVIQNPEIATRLASAEGIDSSSTKLSPAQFSAYMDTQVNTWSDAIKAAGSSLKQ